MPVTFISFIHTSLAQSINYDIDPRKTENRSLIRTLHCNLKTAYREFMLVKREYLKPDGIVAWRGFISFEDGEVTPKQALDITEEILRELLNDRFQVILSVHTNTDHLHCHFLCNSVSYLDGVHLKGNLLYASLFQNISNEVCRRHQLSVSHRENSRSRCYYVEKLEKEGKPTCRRLVREAFDDAIRCSTGLWDLEKNLQEMGIRCSCDPDEALWIAKFAVSGRKVFLKHLGENYTPEAIEDRIDSLRRWDRGIPYHCDLADNHKEDPFHPGQYDPKNQGLSALYEHYLKRLGIQDGKQAISSSRVHFLLKDDLLVLDAMLEEAAFLRDTGITSLQELPFYREAAEKEWADRHAGSKTNSVPVPSGETPLRKQPNPDQNRKRFLKKETIICSRIEKRAPELLQKLEQVYAREQHLIEEKEKTHEFER